ncbi:ribonuclease III [bacterium]|nr:ribonuclease III [bacterium]
MSTPDFSKLESSLNIKFKNQDLLHQAFVHRSYLNENPSFNLPHNERLEFLGDAVLELVVTDHLYNTYPNPEGELTNWRASLVNAKMLAAASAKLNLGDYLYLSRGEARDDNSKARQYILANTFEAIIGSIYLDAGYDVASKFITDNLLSELPNILEQHLYVDPKSSFQERAQAELGVTPTYKVLKESGPDHDKMFEVGVFLGDDLICSAPGTSKQEAETAAAAKGLKEKGWK